MVPVLFLLTMPTMPATTTATAAAAACGVVGLWGSGHLQEGVESRVTSVYGHYYYIWALGLRGSECVSEGLSLFRVGHYELILDESVLVSNHPSNHLHGVESRL